MEIDFVTPSLGIASDLKSRLTRLMRRFFLEPTLRDQALRGVVGYAAHEIEGESVVKFLRQILCHVVGDVFFCRDIYDAELILADAIANPMKPHIDCLAVLLLDGVVG